MNPIPRLIAILCVAVFAPLLSAQTFQFRTLKNPPLEFTRNGEVVGIAVDLTREAVRRTGHTAEFEIRPWKRVLYEVAKGDADGALNAGRSDEREIWGLYPDEVLIDETYVLFSSQPMALPEDLAGVEKLSLGNQLGYFYGEKFHNQVTTERFKSVETTLTIEKNLEKLVAHRTDLFIGDLLPTLYYVDQLGLDNRVHVVRREGSQQPLVVSVSPTYVAFSRKTVDPQYVETFGAALRAMKQDGTYDRIVDAYIKR
ncbi:substrate-binding periplasmic protein [Marinobacter caseinilyticus]|uniref:substrate-binding periplasmic protein n=1 Tax=Marinobacter caseinilyticus TaxID=2692195 RepID=UPI00140D79AF|nr:transporter substrate-binding domain-containing protein [Marinobacter caseinilyticus]